MTCKAVEDHLFELGPDGDLQAQVPLWLKEHLTQCSSCTTLYHEVMDLQDAWQEPSQAGSEERVELVMKKIYEIDKSATSAGNEQAARGKQIRGSRRTIWHYGIAASLALVLFNSGFFSHLSIGITTADERLSAYVLGGIQYITHIPF